VCLLTGEKRAKYWKISNMGEFFTTFYFIIAAYGKTIGTSTLVGLKYQIFKI